MILEISITVYFCKENNFQTLFIDFHRQKVSKNLDRKIPDWCLGRGKYQSLLNCCPKKLLKDVKLVPKPKTQVFSCCCTSFTCAILAMKQNTVSQLLFQFFILSTYKWSVNNVFIFQNQQSWICTNDEKGPSIWKCKESGNVDRRSLMDAYVALYMGTIIEKLWSVGDSAVLRNSDSWWNQRVQKDSEEESEGTQAEKCSRLKWAVKLWEWGKQGGCVLVPASVTPDLFSWTYSEEMQI